jgi:hypothetical protein
MHGKLVGPLSGDGIVPGRRDRKDSVCGILVLSWFPGDDVGRVGDGEVKSAGSWIIGLAGVLLVAALPVAGNWARRHPDTRCALDGAKIDPSFEVRILDSRGQSHLFCCVQCAQWWLGHESEKPAAIFVRDESTGAEVNASSAYFVRSLVTTKAATGNRVHVFRNIADAEKHAELFRGTILRDSERPFHLAEQE